MRCLSVVLVRHALPVFSPWADRMSTGAHWLVEAGRVQVQGLVQGLTRPRPALIASSPYLRAVQTVEPLAYAWGIRCNKLYRFLQHSPDVSFDA